MKRPRRSNQALNIGRSMKAQKTIYWTEDKLQKLLLRLIKKDRQEWFAALSEPSRAGRFGPEKRTLRPPPASPPAG